VQYLSVFRIESSEQIITEASENPLREQFHPDELTGN